MKPALHEPRLKIFVIPTLITKLCGQLAKRVLRTWIQNAVGKFAKITFGYRLRGIKHAADHIHGRGLLFAGNVVFTNSVTVIISAA